MHWIDWTIVGALIIGLCGVLCMCQRYVKSTADFLAASRCARRYLLTVTSGIAGIGAITIVGSFEQYYAAGFTAVWWGFLTGPIGLAISITGFVYYRLRETRCLTLAQFFEVRYSRNFRVFSGILGWLSGILNYGIFPAVSVKFFIYFCKLPETFRLPGIAFDFGTYPCLLLLALGLGVVFAIFGGQVALMVTDFIQGQFCNIAFLLLMIYMVFNFSWDAIFETLANFEISNPGQSLFNPYNTTQIEDFNIWYFLVGIAIMLMTQGAWQGGGQYNVSAKSAHEAKMSRFLATWRQLVQVALMIFIPICAFTFFHHSDFAAQAAEVNGELMQLSGQNAIQARVPLFLKEILPVGLVGVFAAVMFAAMLSTDDSYLHSWGSILIQDVILPFRKKPFTEKQHILLLRLSIVFVGVFAFFFSYLFKQTEYIFLFFQITGAIFTGGAGAVIIGGLYTRMGTTLGAWVAMIAGSALSVGGILLQQVWPNISEGFYQATGWNWIGGNLERFPLNGQYIAFYATLIGFLLYFGVSWLDRKIHCLPGFNLEQMLHRGIYDKTHEHVVVQQKPLGRLLRALGLTDEFTLGDKVIFFASMTWTLLWFLIFIAGTTVQLFFRLPDIAWLEFWKFYVMFGFILGIGTTIWFLWGGIADIRDMFRTLSTMKRDAADDGRVVNGRNAGE